MQDHFLAVHDGEPKRSTIGAELRHAVLGRFGTGNQDVNTMHDRIVFGDKRSVNSGCEVEATTGPAQYFPFSASHSAYCSWNGPPSMSQG